ncbi:hypothetical protein N9J88_03250 [Porticoccaceae bacterium]|nr:hypothetical protein [Porticoccaceae bacterium]
MTDEYIKRPEFENFRDRVDDGLTNIVDKVTETERIMSTRVTAAVRWLLGIFGASVIAVAGWYFTNEELRDTQQVEQDRLIIENKIQRLETNKEILGIAQLIKAQAEKYDIRDDAIINKVQHVQDEAQIQIDNIKESLDDHKQRHD